MKKNKKKEFGRGETRHQPVEMVDGVARFKKNRIVKFLLDAGPFDMNQLACMPFSNEDYEQFAQLIGYSVSGFGDLSYTSDEVIDAADEAAERLRSPK